MTDTVTVLRALESDLHLTKEIVLKDDKPYIKGFKNAKWFDQETHSVSSIFELSELLTKLQKMPKHGIVRGQFADTANPDRFRRTKNKFEDGTQHRKEGTLDAQPRYWAMLDIDKLPISLLHGSVDPEKNPEGAVEAVIKLLPVIFQKATTHWHFSSSQGFKAGKDISLHLWYWLDRPVADSKLKEYFEFMNADFAIDNQRNLYDLVIYDSVQLHYTADPVLVGLDDPMPKRSGLLQGRRNDVEISTSYLYVKGSTVDNIEFLWLAKLDQIGDDKDGFHSPIRDAAACYVAAYGKPSEKSAVKFKDEVRLRLDDAVVNESRPKDEVDMYRSDRRLDSFLRTAVDKGFGTDLVSAQELAEIMNTWIYIRSSNRFYNLRNDELIDKSVFDNAYRHISKKPMSNMVLEYSTFKQVAYVRSMPGNLEEFTVENGKDVYNTWTPRTWKPPISYDVTPWTNHIGYLVDDDEAAFEHLCNWLACVIANPGTKIRHGVLLGSRYQGTGKSFLRWAIEKVIGWENVGIIGTDQLKEHYNNWAEEHELLVVEELMARGRQDIANRLKPIISETTLAIRKMYTDSYRINIMCNVLCFTNHRNALILEATDRRFWTWYSDAKPMDFAYYGKLFDWARDNPDLIYGWAVDRVNDIKFNPEASPPITQSKEEMIVESINPISATIKDAIDSVTWPFQTDLVTTQDILAAWHKHGYRDLSKQSPNTIQRELKENGARLFKKAPVRMLDGSRLRIFVIRDWEKYEGLTNEEIKKLYQKPGDPDQFQGTDY